MKLPTLFAKSSTGAVQQWEISTSGSVIRTRWGQVDGAQQTTEDEIKQGKNLGKANATTAEEQAVKEAEARWRKKKEREGYVEDVTRAQAGYTDQAGGIPPMLAHPLKDVLRHTKYPCDAQRKYNGNRLIAVIEDGEVSLWSRKQMPIVGVPHIKAAYEEAFKTIPGRFVLDGECYRHGWSLQQISGFFRKKDGPKPSFEELSHHVYDVAEHPPLPGLTGEWQDRKRALDEIFDRIPASGPIVKVETFPVTSEEHAWRLHDAWVNEGYEGAILRQLDCPYQAGKRSQGLAKLKRFIDQEFTIVAVSEGRGKFAGKAVFTCVTAEGRYFDCCAPGNMEDRARYFQEANKMIGKILTVRFFEWSDEKVPIFPVGVTVRDYEE